MGDTDTVTVPLAKTLAVTSSLRLTGRGPTQTSVLPFHTVLEIFGVVKTLLDAGALAIVTTHDLALAKLADELAPLARNVHFEDRIEDGQLIFDYKMRDGVVTRTNALDLMRLVGLEVSGE